ncbi:AraC family transcriptional regulator [Mameliella alba]|nr:AraC family transcriptional regulator [Mameliella alba]MBY6172005.1 AraC family transcriptional regulator [Mameliella alba]MBY6177152.1 AraC family transcriptional regulator [Mameliella alba]
MAFAAVRPAHMVYRTSSQTRLMPEHLHPVSSFLAASPQAQQLGRLELGLGRSAAIWRNENDRVTYEAPQGHTFSFYLAGGNGTWRTDGTPLHGWPGAVCVMPQGQSSTWDITSAFTFVHLYVPDSDLRRVYAETFDRDARSLDLIDRTYVAPDELAAPFGQLVQGITRQNAAQAETAAIDLIQTVLESGRFGQAARAPLSGGLSPRNLRLMRDYIEANLDQPIYLRDLAGIVGLSEGHLQRSFRETCGTSPQGWIAARRIDRAKSLIRAGTPLAQVAAACGFNSQSHLTRAFRDGTGTTPAAWRRALS